MELKKVRAIKLHFIVARPRTGSTLLSVMLNMHPAVKLAMEEPFFYNLYSAYSKVTVWSPEKISQYCDDFYLFSTWRLEFQFAGKEQLRNLLAEHQAALDFELVLRLTYLCFLPAKDENKITVVIDKELQMHTHLHKVSEMYPQSKFIFLYRNPLDSLVRRNHLRKKFGKNRSFLDEAIAWKYNTDKLFANKNKIDASLILELKYEDLIQDPAKELKRVCSFLELEYDANMLNYHNVKMFDSGGNIPAAFAAVNEGITKKPMLSKIGEWKTALSKEEAATIWSVCGAGAVKMGYEKDSSIELSKKEKRRHLLYVKLFLNKNAVPKAWFLLPYVVKRALKRMRNAGKATALRELE